MQIELELDNKAFDCAYVSGIYTNSGNIRDVQRKCDLLTLDSALQNEYASHLLSGKPLSINFSSWNHTNQATNKDKYFSVHVSRSLTRLKCFVNLKDKIANERWKTCKDFPIRLLGFRLNNLKVLMSISVGFKLAVSLCLNTLSAVFLKF